LARVIVEIDFGSLTVDDLKAMVIAQDFVDDDSFVPIPIGVKYIRARHVIDVMVRDPELNSKAIWLVEEMED
jgi:hypothetical protein